MTSLNDAKIYVPRQIEVVERSSICDVEQMLRESEMDYPLLLKPKWADGSHTSHYLGFVRDQKGIAEALRSEQCPIQAPFIAQQVIPHNAVVYKALFFSKTQKLRFHLGLRCWRLRGLLFASIFGRRSL